LVNSICFEFRYSIFEILFLTMLYIIATPIGNLEDITIRAIRTLRKVDLVLAEDTRKTKVLFNRYRIKKPLLSFHDYNKKIRTRQVSTLLKKNSDIALVSCAGTPAISDPGFYLLRTCVEENISFTAIPGPSAVINALLLSGLPTDKFFFIGFLSAKRSKRKKELKELSLIKATLIIFESPHRLLSTLQDCRDYFDDKKIALLREMTKLYEEVLRGNLNSLISKIRNKAPRGELVVVINNR